MNELIRSASFEGEVYMWLLLRSIHTTVDWSLHVRLCNCVTFNNNNNNDDDDEEEDAIICLYYYPQRFCNFHM